VPVSRVRYPDVLVSRRHAVPSSGAGSGGLLLPGAPLPLALPGALGSYDTSAGVPPLEYLTNIKSARATFDLHQGYGTCDVALLAGSPVAQPDVTYWDFFFVEMGANTWGQPNSTTLRFAGYLLPGPENALYPADGVLHLRDPLGVCDLVTNLDDTELTDTLRGTDLSGRTGREMVMYCLDYCGLAGRYDPANIHGGDRVLGTVNDQEGFVWPYGESALSFIHKIDAVEYDQDADGVWGFYTTLSTLGGELYRNLITVNPQLTTPDFTVSELADFLPGSTSSHDISRVVNSLYCKGFDDGTPEEWPAYPDRFSALSPYLTAPIPNGPDGYPVIPLDLSSPLLEFSTEAETAGTPRVGLSCEGYARAVMSQRNCEVVRLQWSSPHDWLFGIAQIIAVSPPGANLGVFQEMWLEQLTLEVSEQRVYASSGSLIARN
jgi:hypothetical protein